MMSRDRIQAVLTRAHPFLFWSAVATILVSFWESLFTLPHWISITIEAVSWIVWGLFAVDYLLSGWLSQGPKWQYVRRNWLDLVIILLPLFRGLRFLKNAKVVTQIERVEVAANVRTFLQAIITRRLR